MEGGGGRGKGKKGKRKAVAGASSSHKKTINAHHNGKKVGIGHAKMQVVSIGSKAAAIPDNTTGDSLNNTLAVKDQPLRKVKRKRPTMVAAKTVKMTKQDKSETLKALKEPTNKAGTGEVTLKSNVISLTGLKKKRKKRNANLHATASPASAGEVPTVPSLKEVPTSDKKTGSVMTAQLTKKKVAVLGPSSDTVAASPKWKIPKTLHTQVPKTVMTTTGGTDKAKTKGSLQKTAIEKKVVPEVVLTDLTTEPLKDDLQVDVKMKTKSGDTLSEAKIPGLTGSDGSNEEADAVTDRPDQIGELEQKSVAHQSVPQVGKSVTGMSKCNMLTSDNLLATTNRSAEEDFTLTTTSALDNAFSSTSTVLDVSVTDSPASTESILQPGLVVPPTAESQETVAFRDPMLSKASRIFDACKTSSVITSGGSSLAQQATTRFESSVLAKSKVHGHKRQRSFDRRPEDFVIDSMLPSTLKKSKGAGHQSRLDQLQLSADGVESLMGQSSKSPQNQAVSVKAKGQDSHLSAKTDVVAKERLTKAASQSRRQDGRNLRHPATDDIQEIFTPKHALECIASSIQPSSTSSNNFQPSDKQLKLADTAKAGISEDFPETNGDKSSQSNKAISSEGATKGPAAGIDSHAYVQKMGNSDLEKGNDRTTSFTQAVQPTENLPVRPQNAWGASFGMVPPAPSASSKSQILSTTPLSSWFLSKGCANFVKHVNFSDSDSSRRADSISSSRGFSNPNGASTDDADSRMNAFMESLTKFAFWRTWYGSVDPKNLIDPPLAFIPDNLSAYFVPPHPLPEPTAVNCTPASAKKTNDFESLEADIRREKQQGLAFQQLLLHMLQGKTVSGKTLEEEYKLAIQ